MVETQPFAALPGLVRPAIRRRRPPLPEWSFPASERLVPEPAAKRHFRSKPLIVTRRAFAAALSLAGLAAFAAFAPLPPIGNARAQGSIAELVAKPVALPDIAVGPAKAAVAITEYASMTCPHCAAFEQNVFPMLRSKYIDTGKVRFVFREFPLDIKAAAASMLARCIANDDAEKYLATVDKLFKQQDQLMQYTKDTLKQIGAEAGMSQRAVEACVKDQALLDKLSADQKFAFEQLKVDATPTFFINGEMSRGAMSFEKLDKKLKSLLRR
jgi:protein-disulfide isomerase